MAINDLNSSGAQVDPAYNFDIEQARIARQRALAQKQLDAQGPQGQMVSGWYVAPTGAGHLAHGLEKLLGSFALERADQAEKDNIAAGNAQAVALAQKLADVKGKQNLDYGTTNSGDAMGPPRVTYDAPTFNDKLPIYQQLAQSGAFGQMVAKKEMEKDLAGPSFQKVADGETLYQFDKNGNRIGQFGGSQKKTELEKNADLFQQANPKLTRTQALGIAGKQLAIDPKSGNLVNLVTGEIIPYSYAPETTSQTGTTAGTTADSGATSSNGTVQVPTKRGVQWTGPNAESTGTGVLKLSNPQPNNPATYRQKEAAQERADKQEKQRIDNAPKIAEARIKTASYDGALKKLDDLEALINGKFKFKADDKETHQAKTGIAMGPLNKWRTGNQEFERIAASLIADATGGKLGGGVSDADIKMLERGQISSNRDNNLNAIAELRRKIQASKKATEAEIAGLGGGSQPVNTSNGSASGDSTGSAPPKFKW